jgi:hypothetical protein
MNWKSKVGIGTGAAAVIASLICIIKCQNDQMEKLQTIEKSVVAQKQLSDDIIRAQSSYIQKKDLEVFAKKADIDLKPIQEDLKKLGAKIEGISTVQVVSLGYQGTNLPSTTTTPNDNPIPVDPTNPDPFGYNANRQGLVLTEPFAGKAVPFGYVGFSAWKVNPWDLEIDKREYGVVNVLGQDEEGRHYVYNKFSITVDGKKYDLKVNEAKFVEQYPKSKFRWDPRLYAGADVGAYVNVPSVAFAPSLEVSLLAFGRTRPDPDWTLLGLGGGYEAVQDKFVFVVSPVNYNIGHPLPLVNNVFLGPTVSTSLKGDVAVMLGLRFGL